jgi:hypothetical protein
MQSEVIDAAAADQTNANGKRIAEKYGITLIKSGVGQPPKTISQLA